MQKSRYPDSFSAHSIYIFFRKTRFFRGVVREFQRAIEQMIQVDFFTDDLLRGRRLAGLEEITPADFDRRDPHDLGDAVHVPLHGKEALRRPKSAKGSMRRGIRRHRLPSNAPARPPITAPRL